MSANKVYVGNLPYNFTKQDLEELFQGFGTVRAAEVIMDRETGRSRGFGFVEMETSEGMQQAIAGLHERNVQGRNLTVNEARERAPRAPGFAPRPNAPRPSGPRPFAGSGGGGGSSSGGSAPRPWSDRGGDNRPRFDRGGPKDRRDRDRGGERDGGRSRRGKWDDDEGY